MPAEHDSGYAEWQSEGMLRAGNQRVWILISPSQKIDLEFCNTFLTLLRTGLGSHGGNDLMRMAAWCGQGLVPSQIKRVYPSIEGHFFIWNWRWHWVMPFLLISVLLRTTSIFFHSFLSSRVDWRRGWSWGTTIYGQKQCHILGCALEANIAAWAVSTI